MQYNYWFSFQTVSPYGKPKKRFPTSTILKSFYMAFVSLTDKGYVYIVEAELSVYHVILRSHTAKAQPSSITAQPFVVNKTSNSLSETVFLFCSISCGDLHVKTSRLKEVRNKTSHVKILLPWLSNGRHT